MSTVTNGQVAAPHPVLTVAGHAAVVVSVGLGLLNVAFVLYAGWLLLVRAVLGMLAGESASPEAVALTADVVVLVTWLLVVRSLTAWALRRWPTALGTAAWLAVPTASVLLPVGLALVESPILVPFTVCGVLVAGVLWLMWRAHQPWEQLLGVAWVALWLAAITLLGIDI